ncbi:hypothetical protein ACP70R_012076 [Stipagrostis hirtigluma subsp. patula]
MTSSSTPSPCATTTPIMADSSSGSVVELGSSAADLDTATSAFFFRDGDAVDLSFPAAEEIKSTLTSQDHLRRLCTKYGVPSVYTAVCANQCPCKTPPEGSNAIGVYADALDAGMRLPLHDFYLKFLRHYGLAPSQLAPNAWRYMAAFVLLCRDAGVEPLLSVFKCLFSVYTHRGDSLGWHHFRPSTVFSPSGEPRRLFNGNMPNYGGWKTKFFFLEVPPATTWPFQVRWGKPRRADAGKMTVNMLSDEARTAADKLLRLVEVAGAVTTGIDIMSFLAHRSLPVGDLLALTPLQAVVKAEAMAAAGSAPTRKRRTPEASTSAPPRQSFAQARTTAPEAFTLPPPQQQSFAPAASTTPEAFTAPPPPHQSFAPEAFTATAPPPQQSFGAPATSTTPPGFTPEAASDSPAPPRRRLGCLRRQLQAAKDWSSLLSEYDQLADEAAKLKQEHADEVAKLKQSHAAEVAKLKKVQGAKLAQLCQQLRDKHAADVAMLKKEHAAQVNHLMDAAAEELADAKAKALEQMIVVENHNFQRLAKFHTKGVNDAKNWFVTRFPCLEGEIKTLDLSRLVRGPQGPADQ